MRLPLLAPIVVAGLLLSCNTPPHDTSEQLFRRMDNTEISGEFFKLEQAETICPDLYVLLHVPKRMSANGLHPKTPRSIPPTSVSTSYWHSCSPARRTASSKLHPHALRRDKAPLTQKICVHGCFSIKATDRRIDKTPQANVRLGRPQRVYPSQQRCGMGENEETGDGTLRTAGWNHLNNREGAALTKRAASHRAAASDSAATPSRLQPGLLTLDHANQNRVAFYLLRDGGCFAIVPRTL